MSSYSRSGLYPANDEDICANCTWLREVTDPFERGLAAANRGAP
jgi:hypothetical protein